MLSHPVSSKRCQLKMWTRMSPKTKSKYWDACWNMRLITKPRWPHYLPWPFVWLCLTHVIRLGPLTSPVGGSGAFVCHCLHYNPHRPSYISSRERPSLALNGTDSIYIDDTSRISCSAKTDLKSECRALKTNLGGAGSFKILRVTHLLLPGCRWEVGIHLKLGTNTKEIPTKYQKHSRAAALSGIEISPTLTLYLDGRVAEIEINVSSFESQIIIIISNIVSHLIQKIFFQPSLKWHHHRCSTWACSFLFIGKKMRQLWAGFSIL